MNPRSFFKLSFCTFTCLSNNTHFFMGFSKFVSALLLCMLYLSYYYQSEVVKVKKNLGPEFFKVKLQSLICNIMC